MQVMFMVMVEVSQGVGRFGEKILATSWNVGHAPSAWAANSTVPLSSSDFCTGLRADAEEDNL